MDRNCLKIVYGDTVLKKCENQNDWLDYWSGRKKMKVKKTNNLKKKITGSIIGPAMAGPTGPFATALWGHPNSMYCRFCIRHEIPKLIQDNYLPGKVLEKINTRSYSGFVHYAQNDIISEYESMCCIGNCYICND